MNKAAALALAAGFFLVLTLLPAASALNGFSVSATATPVEVTAGGKVNIDISITNTGNQTYTPVILLVYVYPVTSNVADVAPLTPNTVIASLAAGRTANVTVAFTPKSAGSYTLTVKIFSPTTESANLKDIRDISPLFLAEVEEVTPADGLPFMAIIGAVVAIVAIVAILLVVMSRRKKVSEPVGEKTPEPAAPEQAETKIEGKFPKDYYKFRREKLGRLKPVGLTRSGNTILGNIRKAEEKDSMLDQAVPVISCPRCGIPMERNWKTCHNCGAKNAIERAKAEIDKLEKLGGSVNNLKEMLESADSSREAKNYDEAETYAHDVLDRARNQARRLEESQRPAGEQPSYSAGESATVEEAASVGTPATVEGEIAKGYSEETFGTQGYQDTSGTKEYSAAKKAEKKEPNPCWKCGQGLRPEWKKCPYCNAPQDGVCTACGRGVKMRWNNCPQCRADLTVEKPKLACPVCNAELPAEGDCHSCRALTLKDTTTRLVKEVKAKGADVVEAESLIGRGELAIKIKNYEKAASHFQRAEELALRSRKEYRTKRLNARLEAAGSLLKSVSEDGADVTEARATLGKARLALSEDRIDDGLTLVETVNNQVEEAIARAGPAGPATPIPVLVKKPAVVADVKVKPRCPHCQEQIAEGLDKCPLCLSDLKGRCPRCGAVVKPGWKVCPACESPLN